MELYGAVEAGGTKILMAVGRAGEEPLALERIPKTDPGKTLDRIIGFFRARAAEGYAIRALGGAASVRWIWTPRPLDGASSLRLRNRGGREQTWPAL
jgi:hypothetical protein